MATRGKRGQAFETMMLVISVIVAIAILTILLGFLGGISFGATDAKSVISDLLKSVERKGIGIESKDKAELGKGDIISAATVVAGTAIQASEVEFMCATATKSASICGSGAQIKVTQGPPGRLVGGTTKINVAVAACKGPGGVSGATDNYVVCIGHVNDAGKANGPSDTCASRCGI